jgi:hypothetical protein
LFVSLASVGRDGYATILRVGNGTTSRPDLSFRCSIDTASTLIIGGRGCEGAHIGDELRVRDHALATRFATVSVTDLAQLGVFRRARSIERTRRSFRVMSGQRLPPSFGLTYRLCGEGGAGVGAGRSSKDLVVASFAGLDAVCKCLVEQAL